MITQFFYCSNPQSGKKMEHVTIDNQLSVGGYVFRRGYAGGGGGEEDQVEKEEKEEEPSLPLLKLRLCRTW